MSRDDETIGLFSPPFIKIGQVDIGRLSALSALTAANVVQFPVLPKPAATAYSFQVAFKFDPKGLRRLERMLHDVELEEARARFRRQRPFRKAVRRSLSRKRVAATRYWHSTKTERDALDALDREFQLPVTDWRQFWAYPYKTLKSVRR